MTFAPPTSDLSTGEVIPSLLPVVDACVGRQTGNKMRDVIDQERLVASDGLFSEGGGEVVELEEPLGRFKKGGPATRVFGRERSRGEVIRGPWEHTVETVYIPRAPRSTKYMMRCAISAKEIAWVPSLEGRTGSIISAGDERGDDQRGAPRCPRAKQTRGCAVNEVHGPPVVRLAQGVPLGWSSSTGLDRGQWQAAEIPRGQTVKLKRDPRAEGGWQIAESSIPGHVGVPFQEEVGRVRGAAGGLGEGIIRGGRGGDGQCRRKRKNFGPILSLLQDSPQELHQEKIAEKTGGVEDSTAEEVRTWSGGRSRNAMRPSSKVQKRTWSHAGKTSDQTLPLCQGLGVCVRGRGFGVPDASGAHRKCVSKPSKHQEAPELVACVVEWEKAQQASPAGPTEGRVSPAVDQWEVGEDEEPPSLSVPCRANLLLVKGDRGWRERGVRVLMRTGGDSSQLLAVVRDGVGDGGEVEEGMEGMEGMEVLFSVRPGGYSPEVEDVGESRRIWRGGEDWSLEFCARGEWVRFREVHEECFQRNKKVRQKKRILVPGVREVAEYEERSKGGRFERPAWYLSTTDRGVVALLERSRCVYDMDSEDEEWLAEENRRRRARTVTEREGDVGGVEVGGVNDTGGAGEEGGVGSEDLAAVRDEEVGGEAEIGYSEFERVMERLEKEMFAVGMQLWDEEVEEEVVRGIHGHWWGKRERKGMALVRQFQPPPLEQYQRQLAAWHASIHQKMAENPGLSRTQIVIHNRKPSVLPFCHRPKENRGRAGQRKWEMEGGRAMGGGGGGAGGGEFHISNLQNELQEVVNDLNQGEAASCQLGVSQLVSGRKRKVTTSIGSRLTKAARTASLVERALVADLAGVFGAVGQKRARLHPCAPATGLTWRGERGGKERLGEAEGRGGCEERGQREGGLDGWIEQKNRSRITQPFATSAVFKRKRRMRKVEEGRRARLGDRGGDEQAGVGEGGGGMGVRSEGGGVWEAKENGVRLGESVLLEVPGVNRSSSWTLPGGKPSFRRRRSAVKADTSPLDGLRRTARRARAAAVEKRRIADELADTARRLQQKAEEAKALAEEMKRAEEMEAWVEAKEGMALEGGKMRRRRQGAGVVGGSQVLTWKCTKWRGADGDGVGEEWKRASDRKEGLLLVALHANGGISEIEGWGGTVRGRGVGGQEGAGS